MYPTKYSLADVVNGLLRRRRDSPMSTQTSDDGSIATHTPDEHNETPGEEHTDFEQDLKTQYERTQHERVENNRQQLVQKTDLLESKNRTLESALRQERLANKKLRGALETSSDYNAALKRRTVELIEKASQLTAEFLLHPHWAKEVGASTPTQSKTSVYIVRPPTSDIDSVVGIGSAMQDGIQSLTDFGVRPNNANLISEDPQKVTALVGSKDDTKYALYFRPLASFEGQPSYMMLAVPETARTKGQQIVKGVLDMLHKAGVPVGYPNTPVHINVTSQKKSSQLEDLAEQYLHPPVNPTDDTLHSLSTRIRSHGLYIDYASEESTIPSFVKAMEMFYASGAPVVVRGPQILEPSLKLYTGVDSTITFESSDGEDTLPQAAQFS